MQDESIFLRDVGFELKQLITDDIIRNNSVEKIVGFNDRDFVNYMDTRCPSIASFIAAAIFPARGKDEEKWGQRAQVYGMLFKSRYPNNQPSVIASRNDQLLLASGAKKVAFKWMNAMGWCNSYRTALEKNKKMVEGFAEDTLSWKDASEKIHILKDEVEKDLETSTIDLSFFERDCDIKEQIQHCFEKFGGGEAEGVFLDEAAKTPNLQKAASTAIQKLEPLPYQVCINILNLLTFHNICNRVSLAL